MDIYLDSEAQSVFPQVLHAAQRHALELYVVTKDYLPAVANLHLILLQDGQKNGDAWIVGNIARGDICVTADAGIASACMLRGAVALCPSGRQWGVEVPTERARGVSEAWPASLRGFAVRLETVILANRAVASRDTSPVSGFARPGARPVVARLPSARATAG